MVMEKGGEQIKDGGIEKSERQRTWVNRESEGEGECQGTVKARGQGKPRDGESKGT